MSAVNIFVSSTCYDLSQIRSDIRDFITDLGHSPILSEDPDFPIDPSLSSMENCLKIVQEKADIFILIIGSKYGHKLESGKSITNTEFQTAVEKGIPIYTFTLKGMLSVLPIWNKNPTADYSDYVDDNAIFSFVQEVREKSGLWNFGFESANDIKFILKAQLSNLFNIALCDRSKIRNLGYDDLYSKISTKALNILLNKGEAYEYLFFMQCMSDEIEKHKDLSYDYQYSIILKSQHQVRSVSEYIAWSQLKIGEIRNIIESLNSLFYEAMPFFIAEPGTPSDINGLYYSANAYGRLYAALMEWSIEVLSTVVIDELEAAKRLLSQMSRAAISEIKEYPKRSIDMINQSILASKTKENEGEKTEVSLVLHLTIDSDIVEKHSKELEALTQLIQCGQLEF